MTTIVAVSPAPRAEWRQILHADPDGLPSQHPDWLDAACAGGRYEDASRLYELGGRRFVLPALRRKVAGRAVPIDSSFPEAWGFGGLVGVDLTADVVRAVVEDLAADHTAHMAIRPNPLHGEIWAAGVPSGVTVRNAHAHVVDLSAGAGAAWDRFSPARRRNIRKARNAGLDIECDTSGRLLEEFHQLLQASFERWALAQHEPAALARWRGNRRDPLAKFQAVSASLGPRLRTWIARVNGRAAAGLLVLQDRNAHYTRGAMDKELAGPSRANDLLHWLAIEDAAEAGCRSYHMGETRPGSSLARFKAGFGARAVGYARYEIERWPIGRADRVLRRAAKRVLRVHDA